MIERASVLKNLKTYDPRKVSVAVLASHSALDVCDGAVDEGFRTVAICEAGREKTYSDYFRAKRGPDGRPLRGIVDEAIVLPKFKDVLTADAQKRLLKQQSIFVPNRSFSSYAKVQTIEDEFAVPILGSRSMLKVEERDGKDSYYNLLEKAGIPFPPEVKRPEDIEGLSIVKLHHAKKKLERGFFTCASHEEYVKKSEAMIRAGTIERASLANARIENYIIGPVFNFNFFHSPLEETMSPIELLGIDWRFESSLDGHVRLPAPQQMSLREGEMWPEYTVVGHNSATIRESLLEKVFDMAERFVGAARTHYAPGIIGPFCLQTCVDKDMDFFCYDVAPRIGGGTNVHVSVGHPYGNALWRRPMSTGRRIAMELRRAVDEERLEEVVT
ncbi:MAG: formate--phosphoribosylaminoimidazolecarboxamide ligase family protein [Euryarchaeota archaeon]|nr:formate--phosphoribosylaminoimidazolecarboxamide ligase family protein [Euryarchaeota archaeon]